RSADLMTPTTASERATGARLSIRARLLIGMLLLTGATLLIAGAVNYVLERQNLETQMDASLARDIEDFRVLADTGIEPETQEHFTKASELMYTAMQYNQLSETQSVIGMQDSEIIWSAPENVSRSEEHTSELQ